MPHTRRRRRLVLEAGDPYTVLNNMLRKQGYHVVGRHTVVKPCHWTKMALTQGRFCYKCKFYGIESHRCIQMSPTSLWCWNACLHCWRLRPQDVGVEWDEVRMPYADDPEELARAVIEEQRRLLSGYKGHPRVDPRILEEAMDPKHVAISLTGEPTLYRRLGELISAFHRLGLTTFLVTRGVRPDVLANLVEEPSQLYVSIEAHNREMFEKLDRPLVPRAWELINKTLEILPSFSSPTAIRITAIKGINMSREDAKGFAKMLERAQPTYIEVKAYMYVGASRRRLSKENMPRHEEVRRFAEMIAEELSYPVVSESMPSRVVLLSRLKKPIRHGKGCPEGWGAREDEEETGEYEAGDIY